MPDPTPANLLIFFTGLKNRFYEGYDGEPVWYPSFTMTEPSDTDIETYGWMDRLPAMREWLGSRVVTEPVLQSRSVRNRHWEETSSISRDRFVDDRYGLYGRIVEEHGRQARKQHDYQIASIMQANPTCFDGNAFFSSTHPQDTTGQLSAATQSNDLTTTALTPSGFGVAKTQMRSFLGRDGKPFNVYPTHLVVPPNLEEAATVLRDNDYFSPTTFGNMSQSVGPNQNIYKKTFDFTVVPELENQPKVWYALYTRSSIRPFLVQEREPINFVPLINPTDPNVFWQKEYTWGADMRSAYDVTLWWMAIRCGASL